ncbi:hypothetical protein [Mycobacterium sp. IDR2000157661]|uniref:hypothetical protein n=1 Tax=Mycobacterium sp. IDR2000157661 TaxID=2867005 RepID=UPI001EEC1166|nr:hypothetical protein [Mycobacterium sp. IDR2000157661]
MKQDLSSLARGLYSQSAQVKVDRFHGSVRAQALPHLIGMLANLLVCWIGEQLGEPRPCPAQVAAHRGRVHTEALSHNVLRSRVQCPYLGREDFTVEIVELSEQAGHRGIGSDPAGGDSFVPNLHGSLRGLDQCTNCRRAQLGSQKQRLGSLVGDIGPTREVVGVGSQPPGQSGVRNRERADAVEAGNEVAQAGAQGRLAAPPLRIDKVIEWLHFVAQTNSKSATVNSRGIAHKTSGSCLKRAPRTNGHCHGRHG